MCHNWPMTIEKIPYEKAFSLSYRFPALESILLIDGEEGDYYLISEDGFLSVTFNIAVVRDGEIEYITDESLREKVRAYLESK